MLDPLDEDEKFQKWIRTLDEDVIQTEYGYERGEFAVIPSLWYPLYAEGLSPTAAFSRALSAFSSERGTIGHSIRERE
jgi:hypothetical protein